MPNAAGMIYESIWRDGDWRKLSRSAQCLYVQLLSQKELDCAGLLPLQPTKWAKGCDEMTVDQVWADLDELQDNRFVFYDVDTDETLIRTQIHKPFIINIPNCRASVMRSAKLCASPVLRAILAAELRATGRPDFASTADTINPIETLSKPYPNPIENNPMDRVSIGTGMGTGTGLTHLGNYLGGEEPPQCAKHPNGNPNDDNCRGCAKVRTWHETHQDRATTKAKTEAAQRRQDINDCPWCDDNGMHETQHGLTRCTHPEEPPHA